MHDLDHLSESKQPSSSRDCLESSSLSFPSLLSAMPFDNHAMLANSPTCHSLVDAQYPLFSDTCGAVPQARYALPNVFGHRERWQILQFLTALVGSSNDPACTRSLRLLVCPVLFPPCQSRFEPPAVLPCQSFCRGSFSHDALLSTSRLPCSCQGTMRATNTRSAPMRSTSTVIRSLP